MTLQIRKSDPLVPSSSNAALTVADASVNAREELNSP
jgi:hypothetical protein